MKIVFEVPGGIGREDARIFTERAKHEYGVKVLCNCTIISGSQPSIGGMTAEGDNIHMADFISANLSHVNWLRIS